LKFNQKRGNIVLSRRVLLEIDRDEKRLKTLDILKEGAVIKGYIKNITDYGVFVDLGGVDGLLHITDMTWGRIVHPSEMFEIGDEVDVVVLKYFPEDQKVSLGLKQKDQNPWELVEEKFSIGTKITGKIVSLTDYGAFIEIEPGVEGLIHVSEMSWTKKVRHPSKIVELGEMVEAIVKDLDVERKRISLSLKEVQANPWKLALDRYPVGCIVKGSIRNVTDFGIFVGLDEGIDGLVHVSDISWKQRQFKPADIASKGDDIEVKVLNIDVEQERLSLGIKQLTEDPWKNLDENNPLGTEIIGTVVNLTDFGVFVEVSDGVEGLVHISEIDDTIQKNKIHEVYPVGTEVKTKVMKIDLEERRLGLSITEILSTPPPVVEAPEENSKAKADSAEEEKESVSAEDTLPETDKEEAEKESVTTDEIEDKVEAETETPPLEEKEDAVEAEAAPSVENTDAAAEKGTPPVEEKEVEIVKETVSPKIKKKAPAKKKTAAKKEKEDAVEAEAEAEAAPSVEKTDAVAEKETAPKKEKEDAVEKSLESKAKNDEDSSEKETIEKPESPESN